jgi:type VI protein secretion system component Hcp
MPKRRLPPKKELIQALRDSKGNMASVARRYHCVRQTVSEQVRKDPELQAVVEEEFEDFVDIAEGLLYKHILQGNIAATIFFLKTRARHRGYSERLELVPLSRTDIEVELGAPQIEDRTSEALDSDVTAIALLEQ